jgi:YidC/Oxa1 family membrane protein insertase
LVKLIKRGGCRVKKLKILIVVLLVFMVTGCTKIARDANNKVVIYQKTGQSVTENIICKPTQKEMIDLYTKNKINISKLPECDKFNITDGGYEGIWTSVFVKPLAWLILKLVSIVKNYGLSLILIGIFIRLALYPLTKGTVMQSENLKKASPELQSLEAKYKNKTNQEEMMKKSQEMMAIYKKYHINPLSSCLFAFLQLPLFFAFLEAINRVPAIFEGNFLGLQLGTTPLVALGKGQLQYLILVVLLIVVTYFSFKLNKMAPVNAESKKQMDFLSKFMIVFISITAFTLSTAIGFYWITSSAFTVIQNLLVQRSKEV